jgi:hypothetical protein
MPNISLDDRNRWRILAFFIVTLVSSREVFDARFANCRDCSPACDPICRLLAAGWTGWGQGGLKSQRLAHPIGSRHSRALWPSRSSRPAGRLRGRGHARAGRAGKCTGHAPTRGSGFSLHRRSPRARRSLKSHPAGHQLATRGRTTGRRRFDFSAAGAGTVSAALVAPSRLEAFFWPLQIIGLEWPRALDKWLQACPVTLLNEAKGFNP